jgi:hypothetical protein
MQKPGIWALCLILLGVLAAGTPMRAQGEEASKPPLYIYVSQWAVPRAQWADMAEDADQHRALEAKLSADGTITGYGDTVSLIHTEGMPTHGEWISATSQANIMKALEAFRMAPTLAAPVLAASKHWDHLLISRMYNSRPGSYEGAYLSGSQWEVKRGQYDTFQNLLKTKVVPTLEKLLADGVLVSYVVAVQDYVTTTPGAVSVVIITKDASGLDKVTAAFEGVFGNDPEIGPAMGSLTERESYRDFLSLVTHATLK